MWIRVIEPEEAQGELKSFYEELIQKRGKVSNIMKCQSLNVKAMRAHLDLYLSVMFQRSGLARWEREAVAVVVSRANQCEYCIQHHAAALNFYWKDPQKISRFIDDYRREASTPRLRALLDFAWKLTREPHHMSRSDVELLRENGLSDDQILDLTLVVGYFNFVNRLALALGVEFNPDEVQGYKY